MSPDDGLPMRIAPELGEPCQLAQHKTAMMMMMMMVVVMIMNAWSKAHLHELGLQGTLLSALVAFVPA